MSNAERRAAGDHVCDCGWTLDNLIGMGVLIGVEDEAELFILQGYFILMKTDEILDLLLGWIGDFDWPLQE